MLQKTFEMHPEVNKYSHSAYGQPTFLLYSDSIVKFCEGTQQEDFQSPASYSDSFQDLNEGLDSKIYL